MRDLIGAPMEPPQGPLPDGKKCPSSEKLT